MESRQEVITLDVRRILALVRGRLWICAAAAVCAALLAFAAGKFLTAPKYQAEAMFYVNNSADFEQRISATDIEAAKNLVDAYGILLETKTTLEAVIDYTGLDCTYEELAEMVSAEDVRSTELLRITVTCPTPQQADALIDGIIQILPRRASALIEGANVRLADTVPAGTEPASSGAAVCTLAGFLLGALVSAAGLFLWAALDKKLRFPADITAICACPVLEVRQGDPEVAKILRAKLPYAIKARTGCPVIGVFGCEGYQRDLAPKLAGMLAVSGKQVLIIDCAPEKPAEEAGLAEILSEQILPEEGIRPCGQEHTFWKIGAGKTAELSAALDAAAMENLLTVLKPRYDAIFLELSGTGNALMAAPWTDGFLLTVRRNQSTGVALKNILQDLEFVGARINAVLLDCRRPAKKLS